MVVHPSAGHYSGTLVNAVMYHCKDSLSGINGEIRPGIVHRIDMDTTGALIVCKNDQAHIKIAEQIKEHSVTRRYLGIVRGVVGQDRGIIESTIGRHPRERKKMAVNVARGQLRITACCNAFKTILTWNLNWKQDGHIKSAFIWQVLVIRFLAIACMAMVKFPGNCRGRRYMPR